MGRQSPIPRARQAEPPATDYQLGSRSVRRGGRVRTQRGTRFCKTLPPSAAMNFDTRRRCIRLLSGTSCLLVLMARPAFAYRPFDSTDAAIAELRRCEIEMGPIGYVIDADGRKFVVSAAIVNL